MNHCFGSALPAAAIRALSAGTRARASARRAFQQRKWSPSFQLWTVQRSTCRRQLAFAEPVASEDDWLNARLETVTAMSAMPQTAPADEAVAPIEATVEAEPETMAAVELEPEVAFEAEPIAEAIADGPLAEPEPVLAEAVVDLATVVELATVAGATEVTETLALDERPIELVFADEEVVVEPEPEMAWGWDFVAETESAPMAVDTPEPIVEPIAAAADAEPPSEPDGLVEAPVVPARPEILPPPVYRPLPPLGPIMPPPPAAASAAPSIAFELPESPPAFVIAPPQAQVLMRPSLPAGLFDGPAPQIRPCHQCDLPVSAKARFCRRCGSAQS